MTIRLGVCSWSLAPDSPDELGARVREAGVGGVQLALDPLRVRTMGPVAAAQALTAVRAVILSGAMRLAGEPETAPADGPVAGLLASTTWMANLRAAEANARLAQDLGLSLVTVHVGTLPANPADPRRRTLLDRVRRLAAPFLGRGVRLGLESGAEDADTLLGFVYDLDREGIGVNFDPGNHVLLDTGDPVEALDLMADLVVQLHVTDARPSTGAGTLGAAAPAGEGVVDWGALFDVMRRRGIAADLLIERSAGADRLVDVKVAAAMVRAWGMEAASPARV